MMNLEELACDSLSSCGRSMEATVHSAEPKRALEP